MSGFVERIPLSPQPNVASLGFSKLFVCAFHVAQMVIGSMYLDDCPVQPYIPVYLFVTGVIGLMLVLFTNNLVYESRNLLLYCFIICWFIAGNIWIYSIYQPEYIKTSTNMDVYCNKTLYLFAFWITTMHYILSGVILLCGCSVMANV